MEGPLRFRCPPEFEAVTPSAIPGLRGGAPGGPCTELWLIRAPSDFCPESLEGSSVLLGGSCQLRTPSDGRLWGLRGSPGAAGGTNLLLPDGPDGPLACAPPLCGLLTITESFGPPPRLPRAEPLVATRKKKTEEAEKELPEDPKEETAPSEEGGHTSGPPTDTGQLELPKKKKKKKKTKELSEHPEVTTPSEAGGCSPGPPPDPGELEVPKKKKKKKAAEKELLEDPEVTTPSEGRGHGPRPPPDTGVLEVPRKKKKKQQHKERPE